MNNALTIGYLMLFVFGVQFSLWITLITRGQGTKALRLYVSWVTFFCTTYCFISALVYLRAANGFSYDFLYRVAWIGWFSLAPGVQIARYVRNPRGRDHKIVGYVCYSFMTLVLLLCTLTDFIETGAVSLVPFVDSAGPFENITRLLFSLITFWVVGEMVWTYRLAKGRRRQQIAYMTMGVLLYGLAATINSGFQNGDPLLTSIFSLFWVVPMFYSVTVFRLFDVQAILSRALSSASVIALLVIFNWGVFVFLSKHLVGNEVVVFSTLISGSLLFFSPLSQMITKRIHRFLMADRYDYQEFLKESIQMLCAVNNEDSLLKHLLELVNQSIPMANGHIFLTNKKTKNLEIKCSLVLSEAPRERLLPTSALVTWVLQKKTSFILEEQAAKMKDVEFAPLEREMDRLGAKMAIPFLAGDKLLGMMVLGEKRNYDAYLEKDINLLETLGSQAAVALENVTLVEAAITDGLTGLYHQKYFKARLATELERAKRYSHDVVVMMMDADFFKIVNDTHGHLAGDHVLRDIGTILKNNFRTEDLLARYGGEEFAIILTETNASRALELAERVRKRVEEFEFEHGAPITVSVGIGVYDHQSTADELLKKADRCLYQAKQKGRNRVEISTEDFDRISSLVSAQSLSSFG